MMYRSREDKDETIVYVGGLLPDIKKEEIESEFEKFGKLLRVWVAFNPPGFAFVEFSKKDDAETAVNALHNASILGSRLRVEISRGRGKGRGGMSGRGSDRGGRGSFRGRRSPDFGRGRGSSRGGFGGGRPSPYDRNGDVRGRGGFGGRFNDYEDRRREFDDRDFDTRRGIGGARDFGDVDPPRFGASRDFRDIGGVRGFGDRDIGGRDFPPRDIGGRDFPVRDIGGIPPRDIEERDFLPRNFSRDFGEGRDPRDFGDERDVNGLRGYGGNPRDDPFRGGLELDGGRDFNARQPAAPPGRDFGGPSLDVGGGRNFGSRDIDSLRDFGGSRDIGMRRDAVRDFNPPRDIESPREFGGVRPARVVDYADNERFGAGGGRGGFGGRGGQRSGGFDRARFSGGDIGGSGNYDDYGARGRFRSRSPIGRGSRPY